ncbi:MAG: AIR synthase related protein, partial [Chloroflexi bacterium]|nr:AIR synthase related protein [Chloroflexota bacterium]
LLIARPENEDGVRRIFDRWDVPITAIGTVTGDGIARVYDGPELAAEVNIATLVEAPQYRPGGTRPAYLDALHTAAMPPAPDPAQAGRILRDLIASSNVASKRVVYRRYDHEVQTRTMVKPGAGDAAVLRLREMPKALALAVDGNGRTAWLDPYTGGALAVAEACRNVAASGAAPLAITDCLNFGNPQKPEVYYQLEECIRGMADACRALGVPVVSGNVSLYNETQGEAIYPTPIVGAVGLLDDARNALGAAFAGEGDAVLLLGASPSDSGALAGSEYLALGHETVAGKPTLDLDAEVRLQRLLVTLAHERLLSSAHDCSDGGLGVALAESAVIGGVGFTGAGHWPGGRWDAALFGETPSRAVVSCAEADVVRVEVASRAAGVPCARLGVVGGTRFAIPGFVDEPLADLADAFFGGLERALGA